MSERLNKVNSLLKKVIGEIIIKELENPLLKNHFFTVTKVKTSPDLHNADVYISVLGDEKKASEGFTLLCKHLKVIQKLTIPKIRMKFTPKLHLKYDDSIVYAFKINKIIDKIHEQESSD